jgi:7-cyano-7-deazaguanine synthase in queuosine biosynthesis
MARRVEYLRRAVLNRRALPVQQVTVQRGHPQLQQMRGFLYLTIGAVVAKLHGTDNIVISETGQTMFLPTFAALDEVTLTTHPTLIEITNSFLRDCYGTRFSIFEPFADLTKAEVVSLCDAKEAIAGTNSCRTTQYANAEYSHCGTCYGCLVRRIGCLVAGVKDALYAKDVLVRPVGDPVMGGWRGNAIKPENLEDLMVLLRFSRDVLEDQLDETARLKIETFSKQDLYSRFAQDVMAALFILYDQTKQGRNGWVKGFYDECLNDGVVTPEMARKRISEVRERRRQPDFETML